jgi:hypothetical protein
VLDAHVRVHVQVVLQYDLEQYEVGRPCWEVPLLVPLLHYTYQVSWHLLSAASVTAFSSQLHMNWANFQDAPAVPAPVLLGVMHPPLQDTVLNAWTHA